jgi:hypothetical protein
VEPNHLPILFVLEEICLLASLYLQNNTVKDNLYHKSKPISSFPKMEWHGTKTDVPQYRKSNHNKKVIRLHTPLDIPNSVHGYKMEL